MRELENTLYTSFLKLVGLGIGTSKDEKVPKGIDWEQLKALADSQGLSAVVLDGINLVHDSGLMVHGSLPLELKLEWIGEVLQNYEQRYKQYEKAISSLARFYNQHGFKMMVLKGYACSLVWPKPEHRPCGDIDIWQFGQQKEADSQLSKEKGIEIDNSHHHHTVFYWGDFMVENHYDFVNVYAHKSSRKLEKLFKELGMDDSHWIEVNSEKVILPSPNLHALFLMRHLAAHFAGAEINLRQVLDWAFFVKKLTAEIDWGWLVELLDKYHMKDFFNCINAICVEDLGFPVSMFSQVQFEPKLKDRVLYDILSPEFLGLEPKGLLKRVAFKYRRWKRNVWKQELCYGESRWEAFWYGIWAKILKPASI